MKKVKELTIYLNNKKHCVINDDDDAFKTIYVLRLINPEKNIRIEKTNCKQFRLQ